MHKRARGISGWSAAIACGLLLASPGAPGAETLRVPLQYPTITAAMEVASAGDTVLVAPGEYDQWETRTGSLGIGYVRTATAVVFMADGVVLLSEAGRDQTRIRFDSPGGVFDAAILAGGLTETGTVIDGFEITGTTPSTQAIWTVDARELTVRNCRFVDLGVDRDDAAGILDIETPITVTDCEFLRCAQVTDRSGAAVECIDADIVIEGCLFEECDGGAVQIEGFLFDGGHYGRISECVFRNNVGAALLVHNRPEFTIEGCVFEGNSYDSGLGSALVVSGEATTAYVRGNVFVSNSATHPVNGGGPFVWAFARGAIEGNTFVRNLGTADNGAACRLICDSFVSLDRNIFAENTGGPALSLVATGGQPTGGCNDFWANPDGDHNPLYVPKPTDVFVDPQFCDSPGGDFSLAASSPCLPENSGDCGLIGALGQGCGTVAVENDSWGGIKARYRDANR